MSDILFITPNFKSDIIEIPLGTLLLGTILREKGMDATLLQFAQFGDPADFESFLNTAQQQILEQNPKIVSFYTRCDSYHITLRLAQIVKEKLPQVYIVLGGPQADITAADTIKGFDYVDFICCGEGENTVYPLFSSLLSGEPAWDTAGLVYKKDGQVITNPRPVLLEDLDTLPMVDYSFVQVMKKPGKQESFPVDVGRGCPFGCTYCSTKTFWGRKYRLKSPERILEDIKDIHNRFGFTAFAFEHDMFTMKRSQVEKTCQLLKELDFSIKWRCSARVDCIDEALIDTMVDAGLDSIFIGIETGSARMQKLINKNLKLEQVLPMLRYIQSKGVEVTASFIYGFPEETKEDFEATLQLMRQIMALGDVVVQAHLCTFLPGTELTDRFMDQLTPMSSYSNITGSVAVEACRELIQGHPEVFLHFREYGTPMREELKYFFEFIRAYRYHYPVYEHLAKHFKGDLYKMYLAFVQANGNVPEDLRTLLLEDRFPESVTDAPLYDLIKDICSFWRLELSLNPGQSVTDVFSFHPTQLKKIAKLEELERGVFVMSIDVAQDGTITKRVRGKL